MEKTRRVIFWTAVGCAALILVTLGSIWAVRETRGVQESPAITESRYVIGQWQGKLAVFDKGQDTPTTVYDVYISTYPPDEQEKLKKGIPVSSEQELNSYLENYTS